MAQLVTQTNIRTDYSKLLANLVGVCAVTMLTAACAGPSATVPRGRVNAHALPDRAGSVKFLAMGDAGTGEPPQYDVAARMAEWHARFPFDTAIMLGDNIYGPQGPDDFVRKFERPYRPLLDAGVAFYAALGNHDDPSDRFYPGWHMAGRRYYTFARGAGDNVRFFALDSDMMDAQQLDWLRTALAGARERWKICFFHHPLYSDGWRHGSQVDLRVVLEPIFRTYHVDVVYSGHDHVYERLVPEHGITYFVSGSAGQLRKGDLRPSPSTAAGYDQDRSFMLNEIAGDDLYFQVISRTGETVDSGTIRRRE
jgi:hypothetical protein